MAQRNLLHLNDVAAFGDFLVSEKGYALQKTTNIYEVLRAKRPGRTVIVYEKDVAKEHASILDKDQALVREFLRYKEVM
ncbi:hypothetical protein K1728_01930 [Weissella confusa]|uniref:hypothetical protein n=1 Tax=Weissella confusa TaxID=1583 RepID=UPI001C6FA56E|nr:hypothetical protein [Weissella confusa]QYU58197.1 hypothetical protein K1728_01930 [Weissella confusa]